MNPNLSRTSRAFRFIVGILLLSWAVAGGPFWAYLGLYPLATGSWGFCPLIDLLRTS